MMYYAIIAVALVQGCVSQTIPEVATSAGFSSLVDLVGKAGLASTLSGNGPFTVFAPTNEAFAKLPPAILDAVNNDNDLLRRVLLYHVVSGQVRAGDLSNDLVAPSVESSPLRFNIYDNGGIVTVNGKRIVQTDIAASNGVIHVVDEVIYPFAENNCAEIVASDPELSTLLTAVQAADLAGTLSGEGPFTIFAPTNDAFAKIDSNTLNGLLADKPALTNVLLQHVLSGTFFSPAVGRTTLNTLAGKDITRRVKRGTCGPHSAVQDSPGISRSGAGNRPGVAGRPGKVRILEKDIICTNGVIHKIDTVIL